MSGKHKIADSPQKMKDSTNKKKKSEPTTPAVVKEIFKDGGPHGVNDKNGSTGTIDNETPPKWFTAFESRLDKNLSDITNLISFQNETYDQKLSDMQKEIDRVWDKVDELENRARRNNVVLFNIPEGTEGSGSGNCINFMKAFFREFVDPDLTDLDIQRAHRTPTGNPNPNAAKPRPIHVFFGNFTQKENVRRATIKAFKAKKFKNQKLFISDDLSKRLQNKRKQLLPAMKKLREEGKKPFFSYPATLKFWQDGTVKVYEPPLLPPPQPMEVYGAASQTA